jgi:hypothetical protein
VNAQNDNIKTFFLINDEKFHLIEFSVEEFPEGYLPHIEEFWLRVTIVLDHHEIPIFRSLKKQTHWKIIFSDETGISFDALLITPIEIEINFNSPSTAQFLLKGIGANTIYDHHKL